jgi:hypothetical protein
MLNMALARAGVGFAASAKTGYLTSGCHAFVRPQTFCKPSGLHLAAYGRRPSGNSVKSLCFFAVRAKKMFPGALVDSRSAPDNPSTLQIHVLVH